MAYDIHLAERTVLHTISFIKIPAPTVEFNQHHGGTKFYWLYF
jgi:hypothetical protein